MSYVPLTGLGHQSVTESEARVALTRLLPQGDVEWVPLTQAFGRALAAPLTARADHPSATESAMDGVACRLDETLTPPVTLRLVGEARAGAPFTGHVGPGQAVSIYTGASLPEGADAIARSEELTLHGSVVTLHHAARATDIRVRGSDFRQGDAGLTAGLRLTPARLALAAAMGHASVPVRRRLRVGLLSGGDELVEPGHSLRPGQTYNANPYGLLAALQADGHDPLLLPTAPDTAAALHATLGAHGGVDLLLSTGGVGAGRHDLIRTLLQEHGNVHFRGLQMRPGAPSMAGTWHGLPVVALPGNPVAALVVYEVVVRPVLTGTELTFMWLQAGTSFRAVPGRTAYWRATLVDGAAFDQKEQGTGMLRSLAAADTLVMICSGGGVRAGEMVQALMLR